MDQQAIIQSITDTFDGVDVVTGTEGIAAGDTFFIYDPDRALDPKQQFPFATIVTKDYGEFDNASNLDRPGVFRLNVGVSKGTYRSLFGAQPARTKQGTSRSPDTTSPPWTSSCRTRSMRRSLGSACSIPVRRRSRRCGPCSSRRMSSPSSGLRSGDRRPRPDRPPSDYQMRIRLGVTRIAWE